MIFLTFAVHAAPMARLEAQRFAPSGVVHVALGSARQQDDASATRSQRAVHGMIVGALGSGLAAYLFYDLVPESRRRQVAFEVVTGGAVLGALMFAYIPRMEP